jgi:hypothetical protein
MFFGLGALTLISGNLHFTTWWGAAAFAPFALVIGVLCFVVAIRARPSKLR